MSDQGPSGDTAGPSHQHASTNTRKRDCSGVSRSRSDLLPTKTARSGEIFTMTSNESPSKALRQGLAGLRLGGSLSSISFASTPLAPSTSTMAPAIGDTYSGGAHLPTPLVTNIGISHTLNSTAAPSSGAADHRSVGTGRGLQRSGGMSTRTNNGKPERADPDQQWMGALQYATLQAGQANPATHPASTATASVTVATRRPTILGHSFTSPPPPLPALVRPLGESSLHRQSSLIPGLTDATAYSTHKGSPTPAGKRNRTASIQQTQRGEDKENRPALAPLSSSMLWSLSDTFNSSIAHNSLSDYSSNSRDPASSPPPTMLRTPKKPTTTPLASAKWVRWTGGRKASGVAESQQASSSSELPATRKIAPLGRTTSMTLRSGAELFSPPDSTNTSTPKRRNHSELSITPSPSFNRLDGSTRRLSATLSPEQAQYTGPPTRTATDEGVCVSGEQADVAAELIVDGEADVEMEIGKAVTAEVGLTDMPDEIVMEIMLYLPLPTIIALSTVSRGFNQLASDPIVWQSLYFQTPGFKIRRPRQPYRVGQTVPRPGEVIVDGDSFFAPTAPYWIPLSPFDAAHTPAGKSYKRPLWQKYEDLPRKERERASSPGTASTFSDCSTIMGDLSGFGALSSPLVPLLSSARKSLRQRSRASEPGIQSFSLQSRLPLSPKGLFHSFAASSPTSGKNASSQSGPHTPSLSMVGAHVQTPQTLDWHAVYKERVELERRWSEGEYTSCVSLPEAHAEAIYCVQILHDRLVTGSRDKHVRFWSIEIGGGHNDPELVYDLVDAHTRSVLCLQIEEGSGSDGQGMMVCGSSDFNISVWELRGALDPERSRAGLRGKEVKPKKIKLLKGHTGGVLDVAMNKEKLVSCSKDASIRIWSRHDYTLLHDIKDHAGPVNALALKWDGSLVSAAGDGSILVFDITTGRPIRNFTLLSGLACVDYKGDIIVSGSSDLIVRATHAITGDTLAEMKGHTELVRTLEYDEEHGRAVSGSYDHTLWLWDIRKGVAITKLENTHSGMVFNARLDATKIVSSVKLRLRSGMLADSVFLAAPHTTVQ